MSGKWKHLMEEAKLTQKINDKKITKTCKKNYIVV